MPHELATSLRRAARRPTAFADVYAARSSKLLVFFARRTFDTQVAADLTAETLAQAFQHRRRFRGHTDEEAEAWLYAIARRQLARYARNGAVERRALERLGIQMPVVSEDENERIVELAGLADLRSHIASAFADLSGSEREALRLRIVNERPYAEVATSLGVTEQAARARVSRGLRHLADALDKTVALEVRR